MVVGVVSLGFCILIAIRLLIIELQQKKYYSLLWTVPFLSAVILFTFLATRQEKGAQPLSWLIVASFVLLVSSMIAYLVVPRRLQ